MCPVDGTKPEAIVFDLGGVLIDWNPRYLYRKLFNGDDTKMEYFLTHICSPAWNARQDAGCPFSAAVKERMIHFPEYADYSAVYFKRWEEMIGGYIEGTVELLSRLREAGYPLYALSNWSAETFHVVQDRYDFLGWFELIVLSGEVGCIKPDAQIYRILLDRIQRQPSECLFIDDSEPNLITAEALGFHTIVFSTPDQLRSDLDALNLLS